MRHAHDRLLMVSLVAPAAGGEARRVPAAGAGIRRAASAQYAVKVRIDAAAGRDGHAVCFSLGEAS
jgi:hypothetical protein